MTLVLCLLARQDMFCCRYQLQSFDAPYGNTMDNGSWQVGDWGDTMMLTNQANGGAVRWVPGSINNTGASLQPMTLRGLASCTLGPGVP